MSNSLHIHYTDEFLVTMDEVPSDDTVEHIGKVIGQLQSFPNMGNPRPRRMLRDRYGNDIRTMAVDQYLLVYTHDDEALRIIALVWAARVK